MLLKNTNETGSVQSRAEAESSPSDLSDGFIVVATPPPVVGAPPKIPSVQVPLPEVRKPAKLPVVLVLVATLALMYAVVALPTAFSCSTCLDDEVIDSQEEFTFEGRGRSLLQELEFAQRELSLLRNELQSLQARQNSSSDSLGADSTASTHVEGFGKADEPGDIDRVSRLGEGGSERPYEDVSIPSSHAHAFSSSKGVHLHSVSSSSSTSSSSSSSRAGTNDHTSTSQMLSDDVHEAVVDASSVSGKTVEEVRADAKAALEIIAQEFHKARGEALTERRLRNAQQQRAADAEAQLRRAQERATRLEEYVRSLSAAPARGGLRWVQSPAAHLQQQDEGRKRTAALSSKAWKSRSQQQQREPYLQQKLSSKRRKQCKANSHVDTAESRVVYGPPRLQPQRSPFDALVQNAFPFGMGGLGNDLAGAGSGRSMLVREAIYQRRTVRRHCDGRVSVTPWREVHRDVEPLM